VLDRARERKLRGESVGTQLAVKKVVVGKLKGRKLERGGKWAEMT